MSDDETANSAPARVRPVDLRDYVHFERGAATRVRVLATPRLATDVLGIEPTGTTGVLVSDDADLVYTVLGGHAWFVTEDGEIGLDPLGAILVPAGVVHGIDNRGVDPLVMTVTQSPPGEAPIDAPVAGADGAAVRDDTTSAQVRARRRPGGLSATAKRILGG